MQEEKVEKRGGFDKHPGKEGLDHAHKKPSVRPETEKPPVFFSLGGQCRAKLAGVEAYVNVIPLYQYGLADRMASKVTSVEKDAVAEIGVDACDADMIEKVEEQLEVSRLQGEVLKILSQIFRTFGSKEVSVVEFEKDEKGNVTGPAFDTSKLGHRVDFADYTTFVVPKDRSEEFSKLIKEAIPVSGVQGDNVNLNLRFQFLGDDGVNIKYDVGGKEEKILFLYSDRIGAEEAVANMEGAAANINVEDEEEQQVADAV